MNPRLLALLAAGAVACGAGSAATPRDAGPPTDAAGERDALPADASTSACPASQPGSGAACGPQGLVCEYGASNVAECDVVATCNGGRWEVVTPAPGDPACTSGSAAACGASLAAVPIGQKCAPLGLDCDFPEGRCACTVRSFMQGPDAGALATWICPDPPAACPMPRARFGSPCASEGLGCDYGSCAIPGAGFEVCSGGLWQPNGVSCPGG